MSCAFGMEACKQYYNTKYVRLPDLLIDLEMSRNEGWYEQLGGSDSPLSDAILDRIVHDAYKINIESIDPSKDISMREI